MDLLLIVIPIVLVIASQAYINSSYKRYSIYDIKSKMTGFDATQKILESHNLSNKIKIKKINGKLTDNFNPRTNVISLSNDIYEDSSVASVAVAAHEVGHVLQHNEKYFFIVLRSILVPIVNFSSKIGYVILMIGLLSSILDIAFIGFIFMCVALLFQLVTLPTEFDASKRAAEELVKLGVVSSSELPQVKKMLRAAAYTYLASFFANILEMLRLFLIIRNDD